MVGNSHFFKEDIYYRTLYGKLFSGLLHQFGARYVSEIEDAIQNTFLKSLKIWTLNEDPNNKENWLFVVARNDIINQIKKKQKEVELSSISIDENNTMIEDDLRLQTILFVSSLSILSTQAKIIFILKNIFGLSIKEISETTLLNQEAIYKTVNRAKKAIQLKFNNKVFDPDSVITDTDTLLVVEEILYAVFNIGFDSFNEKIQTIVNEDLCLEAFSLAKMLFAKYQSNSTSNLLALFCFHIARIPAKIDNGKFISFFNQNREKWNKELINLGFQFLKKPETIHKFYIEAIITGKYMAITTLTSKDWSDIVKLYEVLLQISQSPIIKLNYCFCLNKIGRKKEAIELLEKIENKLSKENIYFSLVKASILKENNPKESDNLFTTISNKINQRIRKEYLLENGFINL
ncbi:MAG: sigma-70 family RNA polymerase sigma factor [Cloacibacterium sp.]|nr:sigma-70 family RNA polymerase sigma factor [Cloacibacterium sp.]